MNQNVAFAVSSYGYGFSIWPLQTTPGTATELTIDRLQRAERLYRVTGKGIYQDTVLLGQTAPIDHPLINANVKGQDSVQSVIYNNKIHWFWGDTLYDVGFGNFRTSGATFGDTANLLTPAFAIPEPSATLTGFRRCGHDLDDREEPPMLIYQIDEMSGRTEDGLEHGRVPSFLNAISVRSLSTDCPVLFRSQELWPYCTY